MFHRKKGRGVYPELEVIPFLGYILGLFFGFIRFTFKAFSPKGRVHNTLLGKVWTIRLDRRLRNKTWSENHSVIVSVTCKID